MSERACFSLDGVELPFESGDSLMAAARRADVHIPHLCWHPDYGAHGSCRVCLVEVDGQSRPACSEPARAGARVDSQGERVRARRKTVLQLLFVEGNHFCPSCEKSGHCRLQAEAYAVGMEGPHFEELYPDRPVDASHPELLLDLNRCILCGLCVQASEKSDAKAVFALAGHGLGTQLVVNSESGLLGDSTLAADDRAAAICPVGAILPKRRGFAVPLGARPVDTGEWP